MADDRPVDNIDYSALLPDDPSGKAQALARALRGQQLKAQSTSILLGHPEEASQMQAGQLKAGDEMFGGMGERQIKSAQALRETAALRNQMAHQNLEYEKSVREHADALNQQRITNNHADAVLGNTEDQQLEGQVKEVREKLAHHAAINSTLENDVLPVLNEKTSSGADKPLPGTGVLLGHLEPAFLKSDKGVRFAQGVERLAPLVDRLLAGGSVRSESLINRLQSASGLSVNSSDRELRNGIAAIREGMKAERETVLGSASPRVQAVFRQREVAARPPDIVNVRAPDGTVHPFHKANRAQLESALANGGKVVP